LFCNIHLPLYHVQYSALFSFAKNPKIIPGKGLFYLPMTIRLLFITTALFAPQFPHRLKPQGKAAQKPRPSPGRNHKVKIVPFRFAPLHNFCKSSTPPFFAPQLPAG
jgi:hypothetical protein